MLLEDQLKPLARDIADLLATTGATPGSAWEGYHRDQDLVVDQRREDDKVVFRRATNHEAMLMLEGIRWNDPDPNEMVFHPLIVLSSTPRASDSLSIPNNTSVAQSATLSREFANGESEAAAVEAGFVVENTAKIEAGGEAAQFKVSQEFKTTISSQWTKQTGNTKDTKVGGNFPVIAPSFTHVEARLEWLEQEQQRRITGYREVDARIVIGRRQHRKGKYRWTSGSPRVWESLDHLLAVIEKRGSPTYQLYDHYAHRNINPVYAERLNANRRMDVDIMTPPFKGAQHIKVALLESRPTE